MLNKVDFLHNLLGNFNTRDNNNWKVLVEAIGDNDQYVADLLFDTKRQLSYTTADGIYLDRAASNYGVFRDMAIGMSDDSFRRYIYLKTFAPKQIKSAIDNFLDLFYSKDLTTSYCSTIVSELYNLIDGWTLEYTVDGLHLETIVFLDTAFADIHAATAQEVVDSINTQALYSFAAPHYNMQENVNYVRVYSKTLGSYGSITITGGLSNIALQFENFITESGTGTNANWTVTRIGDLVNYRNIAGDPFGIQFLSVGDMALINITTPGYNGAFEIKEIDLTTNTFSVFDPAAPTTTLSYTQANNLDFKFMTQQKFNIYGRTMRAICWDINVNSFAIEMPVMPSILSYGATGAGRTSGYLDTIDERVSDTELQIHNPIFWPNSGTFIMEPSFVLMDKNPSTGDYSYVYYNTKTTFPEQFYTYTSLVGNVLTGISPDLPPLASWITKNIISGSRTGGTVTLNFAAPHGVQIGEDIRVSGTVPFTGLIIPSVGINGSFVVSDVPTVTSLQYYLPGDDGTIVAATGKIEHGSFGMVFDLDPTHPLFKGKIYPYTSELGVGKVGYYVWDVKLPYTILSNKATLNQNIKIGQNFKLLATTANTLPLDSGYIVIDFGLSNQEGPIPYRFIDNSGNIYVDSLHYFTNAHLIGSTINLVTLAPKQMANDGTDYPVYVVDPSVVIALLENDILDIKAAGTFANFLIKYPTQYYAFLNSYL